MLPDSSRTRGRRGPSGRRVRGRATAVPPINSDGATRCPAAKVITSDTKSATWRYYLRAKIPSARRSLLSARKMYRFRYGYSALRTPGYIKRRSAPLHTKTPDDASFHRTRIIRRFGTRERCRVYTTAAGATPDLLLTVGGLVEHGPPAFDIFGRAFNETSYRGTGEMSTNLPSSRTVLINTR